MTYYNIARDPFSSIKAQLHKHIDKRMLLNEVFMQFLPIDEFNLRKDINAELAKYELNIESILLFYRPPGLDIVEHIDFYAGGHVCNSSLALPWICKNGYLAYWHTGDFELEHVLNPDYKDLEYFKIKWKSENKTRFESQIYTPIVVKTDIPHGAYSLDSKILIATCRFEGNPSFDELSKKLMVE